MADDTSGAFALVESLLNQIHPGENPYAGLIRVLRSQIYSPQPRALIVQVYIAQGIYSSMTLAIIASLVIRVLRGNFWMYRLIPTSRGSFIMPHSAINFMIYNGIFMAFYNGVATMLVRFTSPGNDNLHSYIEWQGLPFLALNTAGLHLAMGIAVTAIIAPKGDPSSRPVLPAWLVNTFFLANLFLLPILTIPTTIVAGRYFNRCFDDYIAIAAALEPSVEGWRGEDIDLGVLLTLLPLGEDLVASFDGFLKWFRIAFSIWSVFGVLLVFTIVPAAFYHIYSLRTQLARLNRAAAVAMPQSVHTTATNLERKPRMPIGSKDRELSRGIIVTWVTTIGVCIMVIILVGDAMWNAIGGSNVMINSFDNALVSYAVVYAYMSLCCTSLAVLCYRSFKQEGKASRKTASASGKSSGFGRPPRSMLGGPPATSRLKGASAIHIDLETTVHVELEDVGSRFADKANAVGATPRM